MFGNDRLLRCRHTRSYRLSCVPLHSCIEAQSNPWNLRIVLETESLKRQWSQHKAVSVGPSTVCMISLWETENRTEKTPRTCTPRRKIPEGERKIPEGESKKAMYKSEREAACNAKPAQSLISEFQPPAARENRFCSFSHIVFSTRA